MRKIESGKSNYKYCNCRNSSNKTDSELIIYEAMHNKLHEQFYFPIFLQFAVATAVIQKRSQKTQVRAKV